MNVKPSNALLLLSAISLAAYFVINLKSDDSSIPVDSSPESETALRNVQPDQDEPKDIQPVDTASIDSETALIADEHEVSGLEGIRWRSGEDHEIQGYALEYYSLRQAAENGDPIAARVLSESLMDCSVFGPPPQTDAELAEDIRQAREERTLAVYTNGQRTTRDAPGMTPDEAVAYVTHFHDKCSGFPMEFRGEHEKWQDQAVANGDMETLALIAIENGDPSVAEEMWEAGNPLALRWLHSFYSRRAQSESYDDWRVRSAAYLIAFEQLAKASELMSTSKRQVRYWYSDNYYQSYVSQVSPFEEREALLMAEEILNSRQSCCVSLHHND